jgi:hypothetical protein
MSWIEAIWLAELYRETYVAILKSWTPHGRKGDFAQRVGISPQYLSYLCALDHPIDEKFPTRRLPSPQMAVKLAKILPAPEAIRLSLIENMQLAHVNAAKAYYTMSEFTSKHHVDAVMSELEHIHRQATFSTDLPKVQRSYRVLRYVAANLLQRLSPSAYPASYAQTCLYLHDAQCIMDRADDALRYAKLARLVLENLDVYESGFSREQVDNLKINAIRGEAVAYNNLGLHREVVYLHTQACASSAYRNAGEFWKPLVGRDLLNAMVQLPRFGIREANKLAREIESVCERKADAFTLLLVRESWLRCLIQREKWKQANRVFRNELDRLPRLPYVGALHRALLLKSGAQLAWGLGDRTSWRKRIHDALLLMHQAGLMHQMRTMQELYGSALDPILEDVGRNG